MAQSLTRPLIWTVALGALFVATYALLPKTQVAQTDPFTSGELRSQVHEQSEVLGPNLAYYTTANTPPLTRLDQPSLDINEMIQDFPTAAGAVKQQALLNQQYVAAKEGDMAQAMKLMGQSFSEGEGAGSYSERW